MSLGVVELAKIGSLISHLRVKDNRLHDALTRMSSSLVLTARELFLPAEPDFGIIQLVVPGALALGANNVPAYVIAAKLSSAVLEEWVAKVTVAPVGVPTIVKVLKNGTVNAEITIPVGFLGVVLETKINSTAVEYHDYFTLDVTQTGAASSLFVGGRYRLKKA